jgi:anti-sigma B factor antagonist
MDGGLEITREVLDTAVLVEVVGDVDIRGARELRAEVGIALQQAGLQEDAGVVVIDLTSVSYMAPAGLAALVGAAGEAQQRSEPLRLVVDEHQPVLRPMQLAGLDQLLALYYDVAEALALEL